MAPTTLKIIKSVLEGDPSLTIQERARVLRRLRREDEAPPKPSESNVQRLLRRAEVARRLGCSVRTIDKLRLPRVRLPGRTRAAGILESDVDAFLLASKSL